MTTINRMITTRPDVEALATEQEGETLDYKGEADTAEWWELAKDVAAFANHVGGVILVGAWERPGGPHVEGIERKTAERLATAYDNVAKDRCRPSPVVTCEIIDWHDDKVVLAVNVSAYPTGIVGAQFYSLGKEPLALLRSDKRPTTLQGGSAWQFPVRTGKHNPALSLEQAIMHMSTHARRVSILLHGIRDRQRVRLQSRNPQQVLRPWDCTLKDFSIEENVANFVLHKGGSTQAIPFEDVEAVWNDGDGWWFVRVRGYFQQLGADEAQRRMAYVPF